MRKLVNITLLLSIIVPGLLFGWIWRYANTPAPDGDHREAALREEVVQIPPRTGVKGIQKILVNAGVIEDDVRFALLARLLGVSQRLKAGEYRLQGDLTPREVLRRLEAGEVATWPVTIPEGSNVYDVADILARDGWVERDEFLALVRDRRFIEDLGIPGERLEGYLFPDTYNLVRGQGPRAIINMMVNRLRTVLAALCGDAAASAFNSEAPLTCPQSEAGRALSLNELLTLASIVEKETGQAAERPLIACVFLNRLKKGMRLQADPTVIYGISDFDGNLTRRHLREDTPYNTYRRRGLPPTPIANPGRQAIAAVLHPARESYLYFVSRNDGTHQFSSTLKEHNRAVALYQKN